MWEIRAARSGDAGALSELAERIFRDTFGEFNTPADMESYCAEAFTPAAMSTEMSDPDTDILIALHENRPAAYAHLHRGAAPPAVGEGRPVELKRFYVEKEWHGSGLAREMMERVMALALEHGAETLWLGVWEHNPRAIRFYHKYGFSEVGEQPFMLGTDLQRDLIMARPLGGDRPTGSHDHAR